ncbi:hypothetical protein EDB85DRAFT_1888174 [Lactarius pseudohatsudake]|nr:hypothetical protein EDB85DRAFT_1888174 [Lactarius pseudohatsudake]
MAKAITVIERIAAPDLDDETLQVRRELTLSSHKTASDRAIDGRRMAEAYQIHLRTAISTGVICRAHTSIAAHPHTPKSQGLGPGQTTTEKEIGQVEPPERECGSDEARRISSPLLWSSSSPRDGRGHVTVVAAIIVGCGSLLTVDVVAVAVIASWPGRWQECTIEAQQSSDTIIRV